VPSPKFQENCTIECPAAACTPSALKKIVSFTPAPSGDDTQSPDGGGDAPTEMTCVTDAARPRSLVTVSVTLNEVAGVVDATYVWLTTFPDADPPSPKFQA
jgi:hypothetical protein